MLFLFLLAASISQGKVFRPYLNMWINGCQIPRTHEKLNLKNGGEIWACNVRWKVLSMICRKMEPCYFNWGFASSAPFIPKGPLAKVPLE